MERAKLRKTIYLCGILFLFLNFLVVYNWSSIYYRKTRDNPDGVKGILEDVSRKSSVQDIQLPGQKVRNILDKDTEVLVNITRNCFCKNWAVVTTIFSASDAVRKVAQDPVWCLVIVADMKTPNKNDYITELNANTNQTIVFLTPEEQDYTFPLLSKFIPWNHFARKNIGYMYAIKQGASFIWDFDDDNINVIPLTLTDTVRYKAPCRKDTHAVFNPYPYFSVNETHTWPRGFPLEHIRNPQTVPYLCNSTSAQRRNIAVIQSLANIQPDVDAIYRFTRDTPFSFGATPESHLPVMVPSFSYSPFNAQATLWTKDAFRYLALPTSISPRVSDIWRSYIAEYFFHKEAMSVMFVPPYVDQHRNYHDYLQDFKEETDLYQKSSEFIELLRSCVTNSLDLLQVYSLLVQHGYLLPKDILFAEAWVETFDYTAVPQN